MPHKVAVETGLAIELDDSQALGAARILHLFEVFDQWFRIDVAKLRAIAALQQPGEDRRLIALYIDTEQVLVPLGIVQLDKVTPFLKAPISPLDIVLTQLIGFGAGQQQWRDILLGDRAARVQERVLNGQPRQALAFRERVELMQVRPAVGFDRLVQEIGQQHPLPREQHAPVQGFAGEFCRVDIRGRLGATDGFNGRERIAGRAQRAQIGDQIGLQQGIVVGHGGLTQAVPYQGRDHRMRGRAHQFQQRKARRRGQRHAVEFREARAQPRPGPAGVAQRQLVHPVADRFRMGFEQAGAFQVLLWQA